MTRRRDARPRPDKRARPQAQPKAQHRPPFELAALPLKHPATILVALAAAAGIILSVSFRILDTDFWQHLLVGKAIWQLHRVPQEHLWTWANYGMREVLPSWGFRALIWPVWEVGGITGLFAWRWVTTLLAFGFAWAAARSMGARGLAPLIVAAWCSLVYRHRSQIRPETLAAVLLAIEIWMLESWRRGRTGGGEAKAHDAASARGSWGDGLRTSRGWIAGLAIVASVWANSHISYFLFFIVLGAHILDAAWRNRRMPRPLVLAFVISVAAAFLNPFGAAALWQPFDYFFRLRNEPMFRGIGELQPLSWLNNQRNGIFIMLPLWPLLALLRIRRRGFDLVEALLCVFMTWYLVQSERFFGSYAVTAAAYFGRDADEWLRSRRWLAWVAPAPVRAALAIVAIAALGAAEWRRADRPLSISVDMSRFPLHAMDFMEQHGIRGHGFSQTRLAGYQLWRFWPDSTRLPFMDIHQTGTRLDRDRYVFAMSRSAGWRTLDVGQRFDYAIADVYAADSLLAGIDADTTMRLVFLDDAAALYVRRGGALAAVADLFGFPHLGAGATRVEAGFASATADPLTRAQLEEELRRMEASSPLHARASMLRGMLALSEQRLDDARQHVDEALRVDPHTPLAHFRLAGLALFQNRPRDAIAEFERERAIGGERTGIDLGLGMAHKALGDSVQARVFFQREIDRWPGSPSARAAEAAMQGAP